MSKVKSVLLVVLMFLIAGNILAGDQTKFQNTLKQYFNKMNIEVKKAETADEKRAIMNEALNNLDNVFEKVQKYSSVTTEDAQSIQIIRNEIEDKINELNGLNGYTKVANADLNSFANYLQNNMEIADTTIVISLTTLLLIIILLILLL